MGGKGRVKGTRAERAKKAQGVKTNQQHTVVKTKQDKKARAEAQQQRPVKRRHKSGRQTRTEMRQRAQKGEE